MGAPEGGDRVAVLVPMQVELVPVVRRLGLARDGDGDAAVWRGRRREREVVAALIGVGPSPAVAATGRALDRWAPDHVLVAGVAGAIDPALRISDLVRPAWARDLVTGEEVAATPLGTERFDAGGIVTTGGWNDEAELRRQGERGAVVVDMETAAVGRVCAERGVPWSACRTVSDRIDDGIVDPAIAGLVRPDGRPDLGAVARYLGPAPWRVRRLVRVARDSGRATRALAEAVATTLGW